MDEPATGQAEDADPVVLLRAALDAYAAGYDDRGRQVMAQLRDRLPPSQRRALRLVLVTMRTRLQVKLFLAGLWKRVRR